MVAAGGGQWADGLGLYVGGVPPANFLRSFKRTTGTLDLEEIKSRI